MAKLSKVDAAKAAGGSRQTLYAYLKDGRLSWLGKEMISHSTQFSGGACPHSSKASGGENLEVEEPVAWWDCASFHFDPTLSGMFGSTLIRDQVVEVR